MRILILGATGRTGKLILDQALRRGLKVHVLARDKNKLLQNDTGLTVFEGSPVDKEALEPAMRGCEAILSALNVSRVSDWPWAKLRTPKDLLSVTMKNIIDLAPKHSIKRVIFISAWGVGETRNDIPKWFRWFIEHSNVRYPYEDHERQEELIGKTSLQWTSVRPAGLTNSNKKKDILVSFDNKPKPRLTISRKTVAAFTLDVLERHLYVGEMPVVSGK